MKQLVWKHSNRRKMNDKLRERGENSGKQQDMMDTDRTNWNAKLPTGIAMNKPLRIKMKIVLRFHYKRAIHLEPQHDSLKNE